MDLIDRIKEQIRIEDYMSSLGYHVERHGSVHLRLQEHSSFVIDPRVNRFYWNSQNAKGSVIDLVMLIEGLSEKDAIRRLAKQLGDRRFTPKQTARSERTPAAAEQKSLVLPTPDKENWRRLYAYLLKERGLDEAVVKWLAKQHIIYPDERGNMVYVSFGADGKPNYAAQKGTVTGSKYRRVIEGSDCTKRAAWNMENARDGWFVTEAAVDAWSIMSLLHQNGRDWTRYGYLSLECCYPGPLRENLARYPPPACIWLAQDADEAGLISRKTARVLLAECGYTGAVKDKLPTAGKDWNDTLKKEKQPRGVDKIVIEEQAVRLEVDAARLTSRSLTELLGFVVRALATHKYKIHTGQQSIVQLNRQNRPLSSVVVGDETLKDIKRQLKAYGVDFAVTKESNGKMSLWFKGTDIERVQTALENCITDLGEADKSQKSQESLQELCDRAKERSAAVNAERVAVPPEIGERV